MRTGNPIVGEKRTRDDGDSNDDGEPERKRPNAPMMNYVTVVRTLVYLSEMPAEIVQMVVERFDLETLFVVYTAFKDFTKIQRDFNEQYTEILNPISLQSSNEILGQLQSLFFLKKGQRADGTPRYALNMALMNKIKQNTDKITNHVDEYNYMIEAAQKKNINSFRAAVEFFPHDIFDLIYLNSAIVRLPLDSLKFYLKNRPPIKQFSLFIERLAWNNKRVVSAFIENDFAKLKLFVSLDMLPKKLGRSDLGLVLRRKNNVSEEEIYKALAILTVIGQSATAFNALWQKNMMWRDSSIQLWVHFYQNILEYIIRTCDSTKFLADVLQENNLVQYFRDDNFDPLSTALARNDVDPDVLYSMASILIDAGADPNFYSDGTLFNYPLDWAIATNNPTVVELVASYADINETNVIGVVMAYKNYNVLESLFDSGMKPHYFPITEWDEQDEFPWVLTDWTKAALHYVEMHPKDNLLKRFTDKTTGVNSFVVRMFSEDENFNLDPATDLLLSGQTIPIGSDIARWREALQGNLTGLGNFNMAVESAGGWENIRKYKTVDAPEVKQTERSSSLKSLIGSML